MKIQWKIFYCLFAIVLFVLLVGAVTYDATAKVSYFRERALAVEGRLLSATFLRAQVRNQLLETFDVLFVSGIEKNEDRITKGKESIQQKLATLEKTLTAAGVVDSAYKTDLEEVISSYTALQSSLDRGVLLIKSGKMKEARQVLIDAHKNKFQKGFIEKISAIIKKEAQVSAAESKNLGRSINLL